MGEGYIHYDSIIGDIELAMILSNKVLLLIVKIQNLNFQFSHQPTIRVKGLKGLMKVL